MTEQDPKASAFDPTAAAARPDYLGNGIRFVLGFIAGVVVVSSYLSADTLLDGERASVAFLVAGTAFGLLSVRFGDQFWAKVRMIWKWAWWI